VQVVFWGEREVDGRLARFDLALEEREADRVDRDRGARGLGDQRSIVHEEAAPRRPRMHRVVAELPARPSNLQRWTIASGTPFPASSSTRMTVVSGRLRTRSSASTMRPASSGTRRFVVAADQPGAHSRSALIGTVVAAPFEIKRSRSS
jgi:hypothetical protein